MRGFKKKVLPVTVLLFLFAFSVTGLSGCVPYIIGGNYGGSSGSPPKYFPPEKISNNVEVGIASWYGPGFQGRPTASGQIYNMYDLTAASKTLPLDCYAYVTDLENHRSVEVFVNDRGPYYGSRIMDLSYAAAKALDMVGPGTALVRIQYLGPRHIAMCNLGSVKTASSEYEKVKRNNSKYLVSHKGYMLQFAAYTIKSKAMAKASLMKKFVPGVHVVREKVEGTFYYKVVFGKFKDFESAYNFAKTITRYGYDVYIAKLN